MIDEQKLVRPTGISYDKGRKSPFRVRCRYEGKVYYVGRFRTEKEAINALENYKKKLKIS